MSYNEADTAPSSLPPRSIRTPAQLLAAIVDKGKEVDAALVRPASLIERNSLARGAALETGDSALGRG